MTPSPSPRTRYGDNGTRYSGRNGVTETNGERIVATDCAEHADGFLVGSS